MKLRPYQQDAVDAVLREWESKRSTLVCLPTGMGKTVLFSHVIHARRDHGRSMVIAHRDELIHQAANKIEAVTGSRPDIEKAELRANESNLMRRADVVVSSVQTLAHGKGARLKRFDPSQFTELIIDEAHHATANSYRSIVKHFLEGNPACRSLGVTATPIRADNVGLKHVYDSVAYRMDIREAIDAGWLAPITVRTVTVRSIDLAPLRSSKGDFKPGELSKLMSQRKNLYGVAIPTIEAAAGRRTLIFCAGVGQAESLANILNEEQPGSAACIHGGTHAVERKRLLGDYAAGRLQFLTNVGVFTEGFDEPGIQLIALARPTKSVGLMTQMIGRGTRTLPGTIDGIDDAPQRLAAIKASDKPNCEIIDFVGQMGRHKLASPADLLAGSKPPDIQRDARALMRQSVEPIDPREAIQQAEKLAEQRAKRAAAAQQQKSKQAAERQFDAKVTYHFGQTNPFDILDISAGTTNGQSPASATSAQISQLKQWGINATEMSRADAGKLCGDKQRRLKHGLATFKQLALLKRCGYQPIEVRDVSRTRAAFLIDEAKRNNWQRPVAMAAW